MSLAGTAHLLLMAAPSSSFRSSLKFSGRLGYGRSLMLRPSMGSSEVAIVVKARIQLLLRSGRKPVRIDDRAADGKVVELAATWDSTLLDK